MIGAGYMSVASHSGRVVRCEVTDLIMHDGRVSFTIKNTTVVAISQPSASGKPIEAWPMGKTRHRRQMTEISLIGLQSDGEKFFGIFAFI
jgi:hypothetical protein